MPTARRLLLVRPRFGTVSPWASKATDIARNCGLGRAPGGALGGVPPWPPGVACCRKPAAEVASVDAPGLQSAAARPHDRKSPCLSRDARLHALFDELAGRAHGPCGCAGRRPGRAGRRPTRASAWRWPMTRCDYLVSAFTALGPQPHRCGVDDVCAGQQRALPPQDLQCAASPSTA